MFFHTATQKRLEIQMWTFWRTIETTNWTIEHAHLDCCCDFTTWFMKKIILDEICWDKIWNWNLFIYIQLYTYMIYVNFISQSQLHQFAELLWRALSAFGSDLRPAANFQPPTTSRYWWRNGGCPSDLRRFRAGNVLWCSMAWLVNLGHCKMPGICLLPF